MKLIKAVVAALSLTVGAVFATTSFASEGDAILTVTSGDAVKSFSFSQLADLPRTDFTTTTIWTDGAQEFKGVALVDFVEAANISGDAIRAYAVNDYSVEIPLSDAVEGGALIAYMRNGAAMSTRDKGPLWIVYPYDHDKAYQSEVIYSRSIWQLDRIEAVR